MGSSSKIDSLRLEPADNGFVVCWSEMTPSKTGGTYGNSIYNYHEEVFKDGEEDKAIERFKELRTQKNGQEKKEAKK